MANTCFLGQAHQRETLKAPLAVVLTLPVHPERAESSGAKGIQPVCQHQNESKLPTPPQPTAPAAAPSLLPGDLGVGGSVFLSRWLCRCTTHRLLPPSSGSPSPYLPVSINPTTLQKPRHQHKPVHPGLPSLPSADHLDKL